MHLYHENWFEWNVSKKIDELPSYLTVSAML